MGKKDAEILLGGLVVHPKMAKYYLLASEKIRNKFIVFVDACILEFVGIPPFDGDFGLLDDQHPVYYSRL